MFNMLPKSIILNNIVETLKKDPENGVPKLLETAMAYAKNDANRAMLTTAINYYTFSKPAKMQISNLVHNTRSKVLYTFAEKIFDTLSTSPINVQFMRMISITDAAKLKPAHPIFPVIDLKNLNDASKEVLAQLKNAGQIFFVSIAVTADNFSIVTSEALMLTLIKHGVRAVFYRISEPNEALVQKLQSRIKQIRTTRPILTFYMKKNATNSASLNYMITEQLNDMNYSINLRLGNSS